MDFKRDVEWIRRDFKRGFCREVERILWRTENTEFKEFVKPIIEGF